MANGTRNARSRRIRRTTIPVALTLLASLGLASAPGEAGPVAAATMVQCAMQLMLIGRGMIVETI